MDLQTRPRLDATDSVVQRTQNEAMLSVTIMKQEI